MIDGELCARPVLAALLLFGAAACAAPASTGDATANGPNNPGTGTDPGTNPGTCDFSTPAETFTAADAPRAMDNGMQSPWGYTRAANATRVYPLMVGGCFYEPQYWPSSVFQTYPVFILNWDGHCSSDQDGVDLAAVITSALAAGYRIDPNRIYLSGFSQGGSGSYKILRGMISSGRVVAGLIRSAGQSETVLPDASAVQTSVWYHIGLADTQARIDVANQAYAYVKGLAINASAVETTVTDTIGTSQSRTTRTLTKNGIAIFRLSSYPGVGHDARPGYQLPQAPASMNVYDWLFAQSLACR